MACSHNILAYRLAPPPFAHTSAPATDPRAIATAFASAPLSGFDHDGESPAGSRLLRILELRYKSNVLVVVTRWYGGAPLGNKRFRAIDAVSLGP